MTRAERQKKIRKYRSRIRFLRARCTGLRVVSLFPLALCLVYFFQAPDNKWFPLIILSAMTIGLFAEDRIRNLRKKINSSELIMIGYRFENGERFTEGHEDYQLYKRFLETMATRQKKSQTEESQN